MSATGAPPASPAATSAPTARSRPPWLRALSVFASMKLTVVLLALLALLTWLGTLAQVQDGIYYVQRQYFESWVVWPKVQIDLLGDRVFPLPLPLPGALPVLAVLFVNLLVGGIVRLHKRLRNVGILITHLGILLLLLAGFVKLSVSFAGHLSLHEGDTGSTIRSFSDWELALLWQEGDVVKERVVPGATVEGAVGSQHVRLVATGLPFDIDVHHFLEHCRPLPKGPNFQAATPVVDGAFLYSTPEMAVKERDQKLAGCYVSVFDHAGGQPSNGILWAGDLGDVGAPHRPWTFRNGGVTYGLELRHKVWNLPFEVRLDKFKKSEHPGTTMARDFSSFVTVVAGSTTRPAHIYMNEPLRKDGYVFYQTSYGQDRTGLYSVFEVASNPSDQWPKWACYVIAFGMLVHFAMKLLRFMDAEERRRSQETVNP